EAANHPAKLSYAHPIEMLNQPGQRWVRLMAQADTDYGNPQAACLLGEDNRETTTTGQKANRRRPWPGHAVRRRMVCWCVAVVHPGCPRLATRSPRFDRAVA